MIIDELISILGYRLEGQENLDRFNKGMDQAQAHAQRFAQRMSTMQIALGSFIGNIASNLAMRLGHAIGSIPGDILNVGKAFEGYKIQLTALEGSQEAANKAMDWITDFAKRTPLDLEGVVKAYAQMRTFGLDPTNGSLQSLVDTMAMTGGKAAELQGIILPLGQAWTAQKLQTQDANQLLQRGVPVWDILSAAMGKSVAQIQKMASAGKLGRKEIQLLMDEMGKRAAGASEAYSKTFEGVTSNIGDIWTQFLKKISDNGFYDDVLRRLKGVQEALEGWEKDGTLDRWAKSTGKAFGAVMGSIGRYAWGISKIGEKVAEAFKWLSGGNLDMTKLQALEGIAALLLRIFMPATFWIVAAGLAIDDFLGYLKGDDSAIGAFIQNIEQLTGASEGLAQAIAAVVGGLGLLFLMKPGLLLGGLGKTLGKLIPGFGGAAAGGATAGEATAAGSGLIGAAAGLFARVSPFLAALFTPGDTPTDQNSYLNASPEERQRMRDEARKRAEERNRSTSERAYLANKDSGPGQQSDEPGKVEGGAFVEMLAALERASGKTEVEPPTAVAKVEQPTVRPKVETPNVQPKVGPAVVKPSVEQPTIRAKVERPTIKPKVETPTVRLPEVVAAPPARPAGVPVIQPVDTTLASRKIASIADGIVAAGEMMRAAIEKASGYVAESAEAYAAEHGSIRDKAAAVNTGGENPLKAMLENMNANLAKMTPERAVQATVTDARQDNRQFPVTVNSTVNQTVTQASQAPAAAARATSQAVGQAAVPQAGRLAVDSAF